ncbi:ABC transporter substrate-binding protein [Adhaeretor mobilis]|uniref:Oligopeptide-binding protein AppA n=1 Tax=Adhaeretor mobilis TaxID=1930276 RepID=A0A517N2K9_9BACT|nr:ABC transporter substrate-binding protein [Adhaeretor mobilis]QDT01376.1 Oligopeptide-binding protein AppA precursor [Adhaeretor mobilis]
MTIAKLSLTLCCLLALTAGCSSSTEAPPKAKQSEEQAIADESTDSAETSETEEAEAAPSDQPFVLGNAIVDFDPPTLEELDESADWQDNPVLDSEAQLRKELAEEEPPEVSVEEALKLKNGPPGNNKKILTALGVLADADGKNVDYDQDFVRHVTGDLKTTNPVMVSSVTDFEFSDLSGLGFLSFDRHFNYFAPQNSVVSWQTSKDGLTDKMVIRDDLTWSDGKPVTAHDIEFSYRLIMTDHDDLVIPAVRQGTDQLKLVKAYDDHTIVYFHKTALATNKPNMIFPILPKHIYEKTLPEDPSMKRSKRHRELEDHPVVNGGYTLSKRVRNQEFVVKRRESYYMHNGKQVRKKPYFKSVRVKVIEDANTALLALKKGDIEEMLLRPEQWESQTGDAAFYKHNTKVTAIEWTNFFFQYNVESRYFADKKVRWAMTYAVDYEELLKTICRDLYQQSQGTYHPESWMFPENAPKIVQQDLDKAEDLLDEAGWDDSDGDGIRDKMIDGKLVPFEFALMTYTSETGIQAATLMKECLDQIGIIAHVKSTEFTVMQQKNLDHEFDMTMGGWGTSTDPDSNENIFATGQNRNYGQYSNEEVDRLFKEGRKELDKEKRAAIYAKIHQILWDDQPYTWLFYRPAFYAFNKKLRGYHFSPRGPYNYSPGVSSIYVPAERP